MENCQKNYSKDCFDCEEVLNNFVIASVGAGMDLEMLHDFGDRRIAIDCPLKDGSLILELDKTQIKEMTQGKLEKISEEQYKKKLINSKMILRYITKNRDYIKTNVSQPCRLLPDYP